jgi:hypothetical protein
MTGSNLGLDTDYPDRFFVLFLSSSRKMLRQYLQSDYDGILPSPFQFIICCYSAIRHNRFRVSEGSVKNYKFMIRSESSLAFSKQFRV